MKTIFIRRKNLLRMIGFSLVIIAIMLFSNYIINETIATIAQNKGDRNLPIYSVETPDKKVSISFDAAWGNEDTVLILDILDKYNVKATFFLCGYWVKKFPEDVKMIHDRGHDIANHSATHPDLTKLSTNEIKDEVLKVHQIVDELLGYQMDLFRPPYGAYDEKVLDAVRDAGYYTIQWDVDSLDWKEYGVDKEVSTVLNHKNLRNGSIILFHNDTKFTPDALPRIIEGLKEKGYELVPISELIIKEDYTIDHTGRQFPVDGRGEGKTLE